MKTINGFYLRITCDVYIRLFFSFFGTSENVKQQQKGLQALKTINLFKTLNFMVETNKL